MRVPPAARAGAAARGLRAVRMHRPAPSRAASRGPASAPDRRVPTGVDRADVPRGVCSTPSAHASKREGASTSRPPAPSSSTAAPSRRGARPPRCRWRGRRAHGRRTARPRPGYRSRPWRRSRARRTAGSNSRRPSFHSGVAAAVGEHSGRLTRPFPTVVLEVLSRTLGRAPGGLSCAHSRYFCPYSFL